MQEPALRLVEEMKLDVDRWLNVGDVDIKAKYEDAIDRVGTASFIAAVFGRFADATLSGWMICLIPVWKDLSFACWKEVLHRISNNAPAVYQFVPFATQYLGIDAVRIILEDPAVNTDARKFAEEHFPDGGPAPGSEWVRDRLEENGVDQGELWARLALQG